mgnify:CR=1 FL=1
MNRRLLTGLLLALAAGARGAEADWPQFRGPGGQGHASGTIPLEGTTLPSPTYKVAVPGKGWSSPVVTSGTVFLTSAIPSADNKSLALTALAYDLTTGKETWRTELFKQETGTAPKIHAKNSHASPTPIIAGDKVFVHFGHMGTAALDTKGKILWKTPGVYTKPVHGNGGSPVLVDNRLVFCCDAMDLQEVVALDAETGKPAWRTKREATPGKPFSFCTPLVIEEAGRKVVVCPGSDVVQALDAGTGKELWRLKYTGYSVIPRPVLGDGLVYLSTSYDKASLLAVRLGGTGNVTSSHLAWKLDKNAPHTPSPLLTKGALYVVSDAGTMSRLDPKSGAPAWQERLAGHYSASPVLASGDLILLASEEGDITVVRDSGKFEKVATAKLGERSLASPALMGATLLVRGEEHLFRFDAPGSRK